MPVLEAPDVDHSDLCHMCQGIGFKTFFPEARQNLEATGHSTRDLSADFKPIVIGPLSSLLQNVNCGFCQLVLQTIRLEENIEDIPTEIESRPTVVKLDYGLSRTRVMQNGQRIEVPTLNIYLEPWISLRTFSFREGQPKTFQFADCGLFRAWLRQCEAGHADHFRPLGEATITDLPHFRLVDAERQCIVKGQIDWRYIALSYVWGATEQLQNTRSIQSDLEKEGSLLIEGHRIPQSISDAINLVKQMGVRYLWVDALCIIQDDPRSKLSQIAAMDKIYMSALLTIVAAAGSNAKAGLPGVTVGRALVLPAAAIIQGVPLVQNGHGAKDSLDESVWEQRAWTYQEKLLSRRLLLFGREQAYFTCQHDYFWEEFMADNPIQASGRPAVPIESSPPYDTQQPRPDYWTIYEGAVESYTMRHLTYEVDMLDAFAGICAFLRPSMRTSFLYCLPETELDLALLWEPYTSLLRRRDRTTGQPLFPSWSWAGWVGKVKFRWMHRLSAPRIEWIDTSPGATESTFSSEEYRTEAPHSFPNREPWHRDQPYMDQLLYYFQATQPHARFLHPTAREEHRISQSRLQPGTACLQFYAWVAMFKVTAWPMRNRGECEDDVGITRRLDIWNAEGHPVGNVRVPGTFASQLRGKEHEFVCLSRSLVPGEHPKPESMPPEDDLMKLASELQCYPKEVAIRQQYEHVDCETWRMYNVLLIERQGDNVYRVGIGFIYVDSFLKAQPERKRISLG